MSLPNKRLELQSKLEEVTGLPESRVHFQPPSNINLTYPCVVYEKTTGDSQYADNISYRYYSLYDVTVIDYDPDSTIGNSILENFIYCRHDRSFVSENLHHDVYKLYY